MFHIKTVEDGHWLNMSCDPKFRFSWIIPTYCIADTLEIVLPDAIFDADSKFKFFAKPEVVTPKPEVSIYP